MSTFCMLAGPHRVAAPVAVPAPPSLNGAIVALIVDEGQARTRAALAQSLDELETALVAELDRRTSPLEFPEGVAP